MIVVPQAQIGSRLKALVLDSVSSPITSGCTTSASTSSSLGMARSHGRDSRRRPQRLARGTGGPRLGAVSINVRITAVRKLAVEAADNGLLAPELANGITRVKGVKSKGVRLGNWLTVKQAQALLNTPDIRTKKGLRDRAILAVLLGCGLRRSEVAALTFAHVQQRDGRWCIVDLLGKHGRVRTVPMPTWVKVAIDAWTLDGRRDRGQRFRPVNRADNCKATALSEKVVWQLLQPYAEAAGLGGIAPHDLRRSCAKMCRAAGGELGADSIASGPRIGADDRAVLGTKQDLVHAPNDGIKLRITI